jgi:hypothetical protein
MADLSDFQQ